MSVGVLNSKIRWLFFFFSLWLAGYICCSDILEDIKSAHIRKHMESHSGSTESMSIYQKNQICCFRRHFEFTSFHLWVCFSQRSPSFIIWWNWVVLRYFDLNNKKLNSLAAPPSLQLASKSSLRLTSLRDEIPALILLFSVWHQDFHCIPCRIFNLFKTLWGQ